MSYMTITLFIYGAIVGSFLNVVSLRLPRGKDIVKKPSHCLRCKHRLSFFDLIPIFSFVFLRGKCRYCFRELSRQYIVVEIITGGIFVLTGVALHITQGFFIQYAYVHLLFALSVLSVFIVISLIDFHHFIIPDATLLVLLVILGLYVSIVSTLGIEMPHEFTSPLLIEYIVGYDVSETLTIIDRILGAMLGGGFIWLLWFGTRGKGMGFGDVKLAVILGLLLGWVGAIEALGIAFISGSVVGIGLIALKGKSIKTKLPFGPFLVLGATLSLLS